MMPINYIWANETSQNIQAAVMMALHASHALNKTLPPAPHYCLRPSCACSSHPVWRTRTMGCNQLFHTTNERARTKRNWSRYDYLDEAKNAFSDRNNDLPTHAIIDKPGVNKSLILRHLEFMPSNIYTHVPLRHRHLKIINHMNRLEWPLQARSPPICDEHSHRIWIGAT